MRASIALSILFACAATLLGTKTASAGVTVTFDAGIQDDYAAPSEPASPSSNFLATGDKTPTEVSDFDELSRNRGVYHTFGNLPGGIIGGSLTFGVRGNPVVGPTGNGGDGILLVFSDAEPDDLVEDLAWSRTFGRTDSEGPIPTPNGPLFDDDDLGLLVPGSNWTSQSVATTTLDLAALPLVSGATVDLLPRLNSEGFLDVFLGDDSGADFMRLQLTVIPEPTSVALTLVITLAATARSRR